MYNQWMFNFLRIITANQKMNEKSKINLFILGRKTKYKRTHYGSLIPDCFVGSNSIKVFTIRVHHEWRETMQPLHL